MKKSLFVISLLLTFLSAYPQQTQLIDENLYQLMKQNGLLDPNTDYRIVPETNSAKTDIHKDIERSLKNRSACSCIIPLDTTFQLAMGRNDDGSSVLINLPFSFNYYGLQQNSLYINNNGNVSFYSMYGTFSSTPFPDPDYVMIAPFWGDVDTRDTTSGMVYYKINPGNIIIKWESVGYFNMHTDKLNTFQLILTDGSDSILPSGSNVAFCYGDMQWTTGDASSGINGFGGIPSTVGINYGNGIDYFQVGRFDSSGTQFDGPYGNNDGIDFLDPQEIYFNTSVNGNTPPIILNYTICDTIDVYTGDTIRSLTLLQFPVNILAPENNQTFSVNITSDAPTAISYVITQNSANFQQYDITFDPNELTPGIYIITIEATDNGVPAATTVTEVRVRVNFDQALGLYSPVDENDSFIIFPNPADEILNVNSTGKGNYELKIYDAVGKIIISEQNLTGNTQKDVSELNNGIYFVILTDENGIRKCLKFVKE